MKKIKLDLGSRSYEIIIGVDAVDCLGRYVLSSGIGKDAYVLTNAYLRNKYGKKLSCPLERSGINLKFKTVADSEKSKSLQTAASVISDIAAYDKKKKVFIIAFGGGVIGDLAGFVASIYKRGVPYVQVPTTLLAQVDSGIGGKTAVDLNQGKNLVGAFYQPKTVISDLSFLSSLDLKQLKSGLAEVIKYGIIKDPWLFEYLENNYGSVMNRKPEALETIVLRSSAIKAGIVEKDEREELGLRTVLNFGHTLAHAIESAGGYKRYNHGEAVSIGMLIASDISLGLGLAREETCLRIENLINAVKLPSVIENLNMERIMRSFYRDKKFIGSRNRLVLIRNLGRTEIVEDVPVVLIKSAIKKRMA